MPFPHSFRPVRTRLRPLATAAVAAGAVLGIVAIATVTAASASADSGERLAGVAAPAIAVTAGAESLQSITSDAEATLDNARAAVTAAAAISTEVEASGLDVGAVTTIDTSDLREHIDRLASLDLLPLLLLPGIADDTVAETNRIAGLTETLRGNLEAAQAEQAAEEAAAKAQAEAEAAAAALAAANTPEGAKATARQLLGEYGWGGDQFGCLESLWNRESGWNYQAYNASSGAAGIPQALPGGKMASAGADWQTNAATQIRWGLGYIAGSYGTPCAAWGHSNATGWY